MATVTFDTLKFFKTLEASGIPAEQAEAISTAFKDAHEAAEVATKSDICELELRLAVKIGSMLVIVISVLAAIKFL